MLSTPLPTWLLLGIFSSILLGIYDVLKKISLKNNNVFLVLCYSSIVSLCLLLPLFFLSINDILPTESFWNIPSLTIRDHALIVLKSLMLSTVWLLAFYAMKNLPITIVTPIWATDSLWTFIGAVIIFGEAISFNQWLFMLLIVIATIVFSKLGGREGIIFHQNRYIYFLLIALIIGTTANLYDKFLMSQLHPLGVLFWFSFYNAIIFSVCFFIDIFMSRTKGGAFDLSVHLKACGLGGIFLIGFVVLLQDMSYFYALSLEGSMISVLTAIKRSSLAVAFLIGAIIFKENFVIEKFIALLAILFGVFGLLIFSAF